MKLLMNVLEARITRFLILLVLFIAFRRMGFEGSARTPFEITVLAAIWTWIWEWKRK